MTRAPGRPRVCSLFPILSVALLLAVPSGAQAQGVRLVYDVSLDEVAAEQRDPVVQTTIETIRRRLALLGVAEPLVVRHGDTELLVELTDFGGHELGAIRAAIERPGRLALRATHPENADYWRRIEPLAVSQGAHLSAAGTVEGSREVLEALRDTLTALPHSDPAAPPADADILVEPVSRRGAEPFGLVLVEREVALTGDTIESAEVAEDEITHRPHIAVTFDEEGAELLCEMSRRLLDREVAILIDDRIVTRPLIAGEICGGRARIDLGSRGDYAEMMAEAEAIATAISAGAYPARLELEEMAMVGPPPVSRPTSAPSP